MEVRVSKLELALDVFENVLLAQVEEKRFGGLATQFYSAFSTYLNSPRTETGALCNSIDKLSSLTDSFCKKLASYLLPGSKISKAPSHGGGAPHVIPLSSTPNYADILERLGIVSVQELYKKQPEYWKKGPADVAMLRKSFESRQKGVHESRIRALDEVEFAVYNIIGAFLVICIHLEGLPGIADKVKNSTQARRAVYLLAERANSYPLTQTLLSTRDLLFIYSYRDHIVPDVDQKRILFQTYLAGKGPCFYWLANDKDLTLEWAKSAARSIEDTTTLKNAVRFLIENSSPVPLRTAIEAFSEYQDKQELAVYIQRAPKASDRSTLLKLCLRDKREEVASASRSALTLIIRNVDDPLLRELAASTSANKNRLLRAILRSQASRDDLPVYRGFAGAEDSSKQVIYIYCLGETGDTDDLKRLLAWKALRRRNLLLRGACLYSACRIADRLGEFDVLWQALTSRDALTRAAAMEAATRQGFDKHFTRAIRSRKWSRTQLAELMKKASRKQDRAVVRAYLRRASLDYDSRDVVLALCGIGTPEDYRFLFNLIKNTAQEIRWANNVMVAEAMARICDKRWHLPLRKVVQSNEFNEYVQAGANREKDGLPISNVANQALMRRIVAASFVRLATRSDVNILVRLIFHSYDWIAGTAARKLSEIGTKKELDLLSRSLQRLSEDKLSRRFSGGVRALTLLDKSLSRT